MMNYSKLVTVVCYLCLVLLSLASCNILPKIICFCLSMCTCMKLLFKKMFKPPPKYNSVCFCQHVSMIKFNDQFNSLKKKSTFKCQVCPCKAFMHVEKAALTRYTDLFV